jgi:hypothetical protein
LGFGGNQRVNPVVLIVALAFLPIGCWELQ